MLLFLKGKLTWGSAGMPQSLSCSHCLKGLASVSWAGDRANSPPPHPQKHPFHLFRHSQCPYEETTLPSSSLGRLTRPQPWTWWSPA